jgi:hypothetical protein
MNIPGLTLLHVKSHLQVTILCLPGLAWPMLFAPARAGKLRI